jgi:hypothetical protein
VFGDDVGGLYVRVAKKHLISLWFGSMQNVRWTIRKEDYDLYRWEKNFVYKPYQRKRKVVMKLLNESWVVNLRRTEKENVLMDAFLGGLRPIVRQEEGVDIGDELKELHKIYTDTIEKLEHNQKENTKTLVYYMESFVNLYKQKIEVETKLAVLNKKMQNKEEGEDE